MTSLSHSPTDMPDWRAASRAVFARFWTEASQIPRTARFHCAPKSHREEQDGPVFELWLGNRGSRGRGVLGIRLFRNRVNKRLRTPPKPVRMALGRYGTRATLAVVALS